MNENKEILTEEQTAPEQPQKKKMGKAELICTIIFLVVAGAAIAFFGFYYVNSVIAVFTHESGALAFVFAFVINIQYNSAVVVALIIYFVVLRIKFKKIKLPFIALMVEVGLYSLYFLTWIVIYLVNN